MTWKVKINGIIFIAMVFVIVALFLFLFLLSGNEDYSKVFAAEQGNLALSASDFNYNIPLIGEWAFHDEVFLSGSDKDFHNAEYVTLPHTWNHMGYGTYTLHVSGLIPGTSYGLYIYDQPSAYALYVDHQLIAENGTVGQDEASEFIHWQPQIAGFTASDTSADIVLQISNFHMYPGGFIREMKLGTLSNIQQELRRNVGNQMILFGGILMIGLYNFSLFVLNPNERSGLYFAFFNFIVAARIPLIGDRIINTWIPSPNWDLLLKWQFITGAAMLATFVLFMYSLFKNEHKLWIVLVYLSLVPLFAASVFILPMHKLEPLDYFFLTVSMIYFIYITTLLIRAIRRNVQGSIFSFVGIAFIIGSVVLDVILPAGTNVISIGIFVFLIFQSLVIAENYAHIMEQNKQLSYIATRDDMTHLYKKDHFNTLVADILEQNSTFGHHGMMFIDIDNFKNINDTYGHDSGDEVIITSAERIIRSLRYSDIASRFGGDEFVVWLHNTKVEDAREIAQRLLNHIVEPIHISGESVHISVSIGISFYPDDGHTVESLLSKCDERMYLAKSHGKNQYSIGE